MSCDVVPLARILEQREQRQQQQDDDHPKGEIAQIGVHPDVLLAAGDAGQLRQNAANLRPIHVSPDPQSRSRRGPLPRERAAMILLYSIAVWRTRAGHVAPWLRLLRASLRRWRRALDRRAGLAASVTSAPAKVRRNRVVCRMRAYRREASNSVSSLPSSTGALVADNGDRARQEPQRHFGGQTQNFSASKTIGPRIRPSPIATAPPPRPRPPSRCAASARRSRRARIASRRASSPSRASAGISSRSRGRAKRGSRLLTDRRAKSIRRSRQGSRASRAFGMSRNGRASMISRPRPSDGNSETRRHARQARSSPLPRIIRISTVSA